MKRLFTLTVSLLLLLAALPVVPTSAADCSHVYASDCDGFCDLCGADRWFADETVAYTDPTVVVDHVAGRRGETVDVKIELKNNTGIHSGTVRLAYDTQVLTFVSCEIYPAPYPDDAGYTHNVTEGTLRIRRSCDMWLGISGEIGGESFATVRFRINEDAALGTAALTILGAGFSDGTHNSVSFATADGGVSVIDAAPHRYDSVYDAVCNLCGAEREAESRPGDANADGKLNVRDLGLLQQHLNGWDVDIAENAMDVNGDGNTNTRDLALLQQYLNGWDIERI